MEKLNIGNVCKGAVPEVFDRAMDLVVENMKDQSTSVDKKREITLKFTIQPYVDRSGAQVTLECKTGLAGVAAVEGTMYVTQNPNNKDAYATDPRQDTLFMQEKPATPSVS